MKIVIDIPRKTYEHIRADGGHGYFNIYDEDNRIVTKAVFNGKKLPEGHSRLISADSLIKAIEEKAKRLRNTDTINGLCGAVALIFDEPTIIEGSEEDADSD